MFDLDAIFSDIDILVNSIADEVIPKDTKVSHISSKDIKYNMKIKPLSVSLCGKTADCSKMSVSSILLDFILPNVVVARDLMCEELIKKLHELGGVQASHICYDDSKDRFYLEKTKRFGGFNFSGMNAAISKTLDFFNITVVYSYIGD